MPQLYQELFDENVYKQMIKVELNIMYYKSAVFYILLSLFFAITIID